MKIRIVGGNCSTEKSKRVYDEKIERPSRIERKYMNST